MATALRSSSNARGSIESFDADSVVHSLLGFVAEAFYGAKIWSAGLVHLSVLGFLLCRSMKVGSPALDLPDGGVDTLLDLLSGEFSEPVLDLIDP